MTEEYWSPCVLEDVNIDTRLYMGGPYYTSASDTDFEALFLLPLPTQKGAARLHVGDVKVNIFDANPNDSVDRIIVYAASWNGLVTLLDDSTKRAAKGSYTYPIPWKDVSAFEKVVVRVFCVVSAPKGLDISSIQVKCKYM
ncbi:MAG: hypothetical protein AM326_06710 [Candidatus Thorarchaeota archaeon SMTZ-45]|nr:MAG: hypothetical protein AM325_06265 [Candidatus Thorarchaeota archaeon SMTZ1-45]KXH76731.1 MAG: hypothetical protein AM326_06710 [Candidatus Thorarchaeota archaeon SMTZ-45]